MIALECLWWHGRECFSWLDDGIVRRYLPYSRCFLVPLGRWLFA